MRSAQAHLLELPLPDRGERRAILEIHADGLSPDADVNLAELAEATAGWTGASLELLCKKAAILALEESAPPPLLRSASPPATCAKPRHKCGRWSKRARSRLTSEDRARGFHQNDG